MSPGPAEFTPDRDVRAEEKSPGTRMLDVVFLDCRVVICGIRLLRVVIEREEILGRDGIVTLGELAPELRLLPLLFDDEAEDDALRLCRACDVDPEITIAPTTIRRISV